MSLDGIAFFHFEISQQPKFSRRFLSLKTHCSFGFGISQTQVRDFLV